MVISNYSTFVIENKTIMKVYQLRKSQVLPISIAEAWEFFATPKNLKMLTPPYMGFDIISNDADQPMYSGMIIQYIVKPVLGIRMNWVTEIKNVEKHQYFIDEQRAGPYRLWHHQHFFKEIERGVEVVDIVTYSLPMGILGRIAHQLFVEKQLNSIFEYRFNKLNTLFSRI